MGSNNTEPDADAIVSIVNTQELGKVLNANDRVLVDFFAEWCGPCDMMSPVVETVAAESEARVVKVDVEESPDLAHRYGVRSIPTFLVVVEGEISERLVGLQDRNALVAAVES